MNDLKIIMLKVKELKPYEKNVKLHPASQIEKIKKSIKEFGFNDPIAVWGENNTIVEGHGRLIAAKELGFTEVPCIRLDHLTEDERKAYTIVHNKTTMDTDFDEILLNEELKKIEESFNLFDFGLEIKSKNIVIKEKELKPYRKVHYLISVDINDHDILVKALDEIKKIGGVEIESSLN